jgi:glycosyltransferase involved in cell wall biosynthesis
MSKILLIGTGPIFGPNVTFFSGQAHRSWHFARALAEEGYKLHILILQVEGDARKDPSQPALIPGERDGLTYFTVNAADPSDILSILTEEENLHSPDVVVAVNVNAAWLAAQLPTWAPFWADLYGHLMGEAQAKCARDQDDSLLRHFWRRQRIILRRADRLSTVSYRQKLATLGELGTVGRLNRLTIQYPFISVIPSAASEEYLQLPNTGYSHEFRGKQFPVNAFALLWSGGFNTWTDPVALAAALSLAMEQDPNIHLVVTGGVIKGHDEQTFVQFAREMERTGFGDRCHYLGWIEGAKLLKLYQDCDLGLCLDALVYESVFGARTRLTNMMAAGLPVLTTVCTEITEEIAEHRLGYTVAPGDVQGYADAILRARRNPADRREIAARARSYTAKHFSYRETARPLLAWLRAPSLAPDNAHKQARFPRAQSPADVALNPLEEEAMLLERHDVSELVRQARDFERIRRSFPYRVAKALKKLLGR